MVIRLRLLRRRAGNKTQSDMFAKAYRRWRSCKENVPCLLLYPPQSVSVLLIGHGNHYGLTSRHLYPLLHHKKRKIILKSWWKLQKGIALLEKMWCECVSERYTRSLVIRTGTAKPLKFLRTLKTPKSGLDGNLQNKRILRFLLRRHILRRLLLMLHQLHPRQPQRFCHMVNHQNRAKGALVPGNRRFLWLLCQAHLHRRPKR